LGLRLPAQAGRRLRRAAHVRADAPGQDERLHRPGLQPAGLGPQQEQALGGAVQAEVPGHHGPAGHRDLGEFWKNHGEFNDVDPAKIQTEVFRLPTTCFAEEDGAITNSSRVAAVALEGRPIPRARPRPTRRSWPACSCAARHVRQGRRRLPRPHLNLAWPYAQPTSPRPRSCCQGSTARPWPTWRPPTQGPDQARCWSRPGEQLPALPCCATTAPPPAAAGSTPAAGPRRAT
jgi:hypothetical protein